MAVATKNRKATKRAMSDEHKAALAQGREQGRAVRRYLEALEANRPRRGRKRTPAGVKARLSRVETELLEADPLTRLHLLQEREDLTHELTKLDTGAVDITALEKGFISAARQYSARKGITYKTWREAGVPASVLAKARITRAG